MGRNHAHQISQRDDACIAALCDTDGDSMAQLQRSLGGEEVAQFQDWKQLLAEGGSRRRRRRHPAHPARRAGAAVPAGRPARPGREADDDHRGRCPRHPRRRRILGKSAGDRLPEAWRGALHPRPQAAPGRRHRRDTPRPRHHRPGLPVRLSPGGLVAGRPGAVGRGPFHGHRQPHQRHPAVGHRPRAEAGPGLHQPGGHRRRRAHRGYRRVHQRRRRHPGLHLALTGVARGVHLLRGRKG